MPPKFTKKGPYVFTFENCGKRRIFAHDIPRIAAALDVPLAYLYEDYATEDDLDMALLQEFHRLDKPTRKTIVEIMRLFSNVLVDKDR